MKLVMKQAIFVFLLSYFHSCINRIASETMVDDAWLKEYPTAYTSYNRVLGMILAFNYDHIDPLNLIFGQYQSMCEGGWHPTVVVFTTVNWTQTMRRFVRQRTYCYRINGSIPVVVDVHPPAIGFALGIKYLFS